MENNLKKKDNVAVFHSTRFFDRNIFTSWAASRIGEHAHNGNTAAVYFVGLFILCVESLSLDRLNFGSIRW